MNHLVWGLNLSPFRKAAKGLHLLIFLIITATPLILHGCSGGNVASSSASTSTGYSLYLTLSKTAIMADDTDSAQITATVLNGNVDQAGVKVTFATSGGRLDSASAITGADGKATVNITSGPRSNNDVININAAIDGATSSVQLQITGNNLSMSKINFGVNPLSAFGTTSISVNVLNNGDLYKTPVTVNFSSPCAAANKANLSASASTINGTATVSYVDNGCAGDDTVTASITNVTPIHDTLTISPPDTGSISAVSSTPTTINLRGTGGVEISRVLFKLFDTGGNAISGKKVEFSLSSTLGGITLSSTSSISDATGQVYVDVHSGTIGTPVRVIASTLNNAGQSIQTQSSQLVISTGLPDNDSFSISVDTYNLEGLNWDGTTSNFIVRLADHFNNPVPDGTVAYFTTSGGVIQPSCTTTQGSCTVTLTSQDPRPEGGQVAVLAYVVGEESFKDLNGNGLADLSPNNETVRDLPEAWRDDNFNGVHDDNEIFIDYNNNGIYDGPDGKFNTSLCNENVDPLYPNHVSSPGSCSAQKSINLFETVHVVFSGSFVDSWSPSSITFPSSNCGGFQQVLLTILDRNGNPMPKDTTIALSFSDSSPVKVSGSSTFKVLSAALPGLSTTVFPVFLTGTGDTTCISGKSALMTVDVTTPMGNKTTIPITIQVP